MTTAKVPKAATLSLATSDTLGTAQITLTPAAANWTGFRATSGTLKAGFTGAEYVGTASAAKIAAIPDITSLSK